MISSLQTHWGFTRMPFGRDLPADNLFRANAHKEAVARLRYLISARGLGVLTGEVGSGKTVAVRAATHGLDTSRHSVIYLPNPTIGTRGLHGAIATALGQAAPVPPRHPHPPGRTRPAHRIRREGPPRDPHHRRGSPPGQRSTRGSAHVDECRHGRLLAPEHPARRPTRPPPPHQNRRHGRPRSTHPTALPHSQTPPWARTKPRKYIEYHVSLAGRGNNVLFSDDAITAIHNHARGVPRAINNLAIAALLAGYTTNKHIIDESSARTAIAEATATD